MFQLCNYLVSPNGNASGGSKEGQAMELALTKPHYYRMLRVSDTRSRSPNLAGQNVVMRITNSSIALGAAL